MKSSTASAYGAVVVAAMLLVTTVGWSAIPTLTAKPPAPKGQKVLLLVKARDYVRGAKSDYVAGILKEAGFDYDIRDVESLLSEPKDLSPYRGIVTAYNSSGMVGADKYPEWLVAQLKAKRPVVIVGSYGAYQNLTRKPDKSYAEQLQNSDQLNSFFKPFGLEFRFAFCGDPKRLKVVRKEKRFSEYQTTLKPEDLRFYQLFKSDNPNNQVHLAVERTDLASSESAFVAHTPFGGMILESYGYFWAPEKRSMVQRVDLATFLKEGLTRIPPDVMPYERFSKTGPQGPRTIPQPGAASPPRSFVGKVVLLYKKRDPNHAPYLQYIGGFVNDAGYAYDLEDVESHLAKPRDLSGYDGIVTAYLSPKMVGAEKYHRFLVDQMERGMPIAIIGTYGAYQGLLPLKNGRFHEWNEAPKEINTFFWPFGLQFYFAFTNDSEKLRVVRKVKEFSEYEVPLLPKEIKYYQLFKSVNPKNEVHLSVERTDLMDSSSAFIVHTPFGGMILEGYGFLYSSEKQAMVQRANMARFIKNALERDPPAVPRYAIQTHQQLTAANPLPNRTAPTLDSAPLPGEVLRHVLVLYKKRETPHIDAHPFYARAEIALNHLGMIPDYWPIDEKGLPPDAIMGRYRGIITWFTDPFLKDARKYGEWIIGQIRSGKKVVILEDYGASIDRETQEHPCLESAVLRELGIVAKKVPTPRLESLPTVRVADQWLGFERPVDTRYILYSLQYRSNAPQNKVHLSLQDKDWGPVDLVVTGPKGGVALENSAFYFPPGNPERRALIEKAARGEVQVEVAEQATVGAWVINPFAFLNSALELDDVPAPDFTTMCGARIAYSHIDGDGFESISLVDNTHIAGELIIKHILERYPELPQTVSVISSLVETGGNEYYNPLVELAQRIYRLPQTEVASHTMSHPFDWVGGDPYVSNPGQYPYKIAYKDQPCTQEIWGSKLWIEKHLTPPDKKCDLLLWSGATNPDERALEVAWRAGMQNLNGGDPVFDSEHPSIAGLCPVSTRFGPYRQYHTSAQNDYIYSLYLTGDWGAQRKVLDHFTKTGKPRRILPMNLYYHFYSGIKQEGLDALKQVFDYLVAQAKSGLIAPVFTSEYCRIAADFFATRIVSETPGVWSVSNGGSLRTLRIKRPVHIDLPRSKGVLGYVHDQGETYVHLDASRQRRVVLAAVPPRAPYLKRATVIVDNARLGSESLELGFRGFGWAVFSIAGCRRGEAYRVSLESEGVAVAPETVVRTDSNGDLQIKHLLSGPLKTYRLVVRGA